MKDKFYVDVANSIKKDLRAIPQPWQHRIIKAMYSLEEAPFSGEKMWGEHKGKYKLRVWPYRIIYKIDKKEKIIRILEVGHRGGMSYK
ncbi:type II toxin-antitoxin system RelE/ParE family toxin [Patescibacteria group bacterium]|nr:type II toxin-antitoxin system RelE/ParE family toxin [Patescibacteria group bacterium]